MCAPCPGASYRTQNFLVSAETPQVAEEIGQAAERHRRQLAIDWLGRELAPWTEPCPVRVTVNEQVAPRGETSYIFDHGHPRAWQVYVQGSRSAIARSVLPHEVTHTLLATYFGQPLPRWAEEGMCVAVEHADEQHDLADLAVGTLNPGQVLGIAALFTQREYPRDVLPLYAQGYSFVRFLLAHRGGKPRLVRFLGDGLHGHDWSESARQHYGYATLNELQQAWLAWAATGVDADGLLRHSLGEVAADR